MPSYRTSPTGRGRLILAPIFSQDSCWDMFIWKPHCLLGVEQSAAIVGAGFKPAPMNCKSTSYTKMPIVSYCPYPGSFPWGKGFKNFRPSLLPQREVALHLRPGGHLDGDVILYEFLPGGIGGLGNERVNPPVRQGMDRFKNKNV